MKKIVLIFSLFLVSFAWSIPVDEIPINQTALVDMVKILSANENQEIENLLQNYHKNGLMQGAVVIVNSTNGVDIFDYAMEIAEDWKLGDKDKNNGLLLLIAIQDRRYFTLTGKGLEGALPDVSVGRINRENLVPAFKENNYGLGIKNALKAYAYRLSLDKEELAPLLAEDKKKEEGEGEEILLLFVVGSAAISGLGVGFLKIKEKLKLNLRKTIAGIGALVVFCIGMLNYQMPLIGAVIFSAFFAGIFLALSDKSKGGGANFSSRSSNSNGSNRSGGGGYRGGGGGFGGGGSGGGW